MYDEIVAVNDDLANWIRQRKSLFYVVPDAAAQQCFTDVANYVTSTYSSVRAKEFLSVADPWLIACAKADGGIVVTFEALVPASSTRVKIPNVCARFGVEWIDLFTMLRSLRASFR